MSRLSIFTENEQREFDYPPTLSDEARAISFAINDSVVNIIKRLRGATNKVGFFLQYAYFKACHRFFLIKRFQQKDIKYTAKVLGISLKGKRLQDYKERTSNNHQIKILELFHYKSYFEQKSWIEKEIAIRVERVLNPRTLFLEVLHQLHQNNTEIPSYNTLAERITEHYIIHENKLLDIIEAELTQEQKQILQPLLEVPKKHATGVLNHYKDFNQSLQPKAIEANVKVFNEIQAVIRPLIPLINSLSLTPQCCEYYATWMKKAKLSQLKQLPDQRKSYLRLIAFLQHQYTSRQDVFIDIFLRSVQSTKNSVVHQVKNQDQFSRHERRAAVQYLTKTNKKYRNVIDEIKEITSSTLLSDKEKVKKIKESLDQQEEKRNKKEQKKVGLFEKTLDDMVKDYFETIERVSRKLQNRASHILKAVEFNPNNSDPKLMDAVNHFKESQGEITRQAPQSFLKSSEQEALIDNKGAFRSPLYKALLFIHVADALKSGELNLKFSYRYLSIQDYLIDKESWQTKRDEILKLSGLEKFNDYTSTIEPLKTLLEEKYHSINKRVLNQLNPHLSFSKDKKSRIKIATPPLDEKETRHISAFLNQSDYIPIFRILSDIHQATRFLESFQHYAIKNTKAKPQDAVFFAGIIGLGCNIGLSKMAQISTGINQNTMANTTKWYFNLKTLNTANEHICDFINRLSLPHVFSGEHHMRHSSSDGRKVGVSVECLLASYSFKYFGQDKGVSIYTFIDDRQVLFHHQVISASEREAAYVIDGLNNTKVEKVDIHSTDSHGYTELVFATTHFLDITFAPRIKTIGKQKIYGFSTKKYFEKLGYKVLPSRPINQKLIEKHWEDILRFMATIRLNKVSASQLFKRLSSYAKDNPLYKAIKEFGRITKSLFILAYLDDVKLRQRIEKQLNRVETSNKFSKAIFYANNSEFKQADPEEQAIAVACKVLIQNSIVLWNYLYLSQLLTNCADEREQGEIVSLIKEGSVLTWSHVNLHGEFDFRRKAVNDFPFDLHRILSLQVG